MIATVTLIFGLTLLPAPQDDAIQQYYKDYKKAGNLSQQQDAIRELGKTRHEKTARVVAKHLVSGSDILRITAAETLAGMREVKKAAKIVGPALNHSANKTKTTVRLAIIDCLKKLGQAEAIPYLHRTVSDKDFIVAATAVQALPDFNRKESVPVLIDSLKTCERAPEWWTIRSIAKKKLIIRGKDDSVIWNHSVKLDADEEQAVRHHVLLNPVHTSLQTLTGESFGSHKEWNGWWKAYGAKFKVETR